MISGLFMRSPNTPKDTEGSITENTRPPFIIFILGPPGAGKGTHSKRLRRDFHPLTHLSYGDVLRYHASIPASWVSIFPRRGGGVEGNPVLPAAEAVQLMRETIQAGVLRGQDMWITDGCPRSRAHVKAWAAAQMPRATCALYLHCDSEVLVRRISGRAGTSGRADDADDEKVRERVARNVAESEELLRACREADIPVVGVDADRDPDAVYADICRYFEVSLCVT